MLVARFGQGELEVQTFGDRESLNVQIASRQHRKSGGATSLTVTLQRVEDGVLVKMGQQSWLGVAASLGQTALSVAKNPWSILNRLDDLASDFDVLGLEKKAWATIEEFAASRRASHQISERLLTLTCPYCDFANRTGAGDCESCGAPLGNEQPVACGRCGFVNPAGSSHCQQCRGSLIPGQPDLPEPAPASSGGGLAGLGAVLGLGAAATAAAPAPEPAEVPEDAVSCRACGTPHKKGTLFCSSCSRPLPRR